MFNDPRWYSVVGLVLDIFGAAILAASVVVTQRRAIELGVARFAGRSPASLPAVADRITQSRRAVLGLVLLVAGFLLQIVGAWPR